MTRRFGRPTAVFVCILIGVAASIAATLDFETAGKPVTAAPPDAAIAAALQNVSEKQVRHTIETMVKFHNRNTLSSMDTDLKRGQGVLAAADWIERQFRSYSKACHGCLQIGRDTFTAPTQRRVPKPTTIVNVYAILRGSDPAQASRMYLVTGHYDSRNSDVLDTHGFAPGANDDASGVAVSLECARVLSTLKFPATLVFAAVAGEEQGLLGSAHLAQLAKERGWKLEGVLNNDIVGGNTTPGDTLQDKSAVRVYSEAIPSNANSEAVRRIESIGLENDSPSRELARAVCDIAKSYLGPHGCAPDAAGAAPPFHPVLEFRRDRFLRGGDHISFNREGFAAIRLTEWREDFNHQHQNVRVENGTEYGDLLKFVDFAYVANVARLNAATMAALAAAPGIPRDVRIVTKNLDNNSTLKWRAPEGAAPDTRYEVVWRVTTAPDWQYVSGPAKFKASDGTGEFSATLPVSKDNVIFGVRSVDAQDHRSPAAAPIPER